MNATDLKSLKYPAINALEWLGSRVEDPGLPQAELDALVEEELFTGCQAGLVFVTAFASRGVMRSFLGSISWETEVWIADEPDHMMHFNGERFLGPDPDVATPATAPVARAVDQRSRT